MTNARTTLPNEEREVDPEAAAKVKALLAKDEDVDLIDGQDDAAHKARGANPSDAPPVAHKPRKERSDKGKPKAVKQAAPTSDPAKRKHLALVEKYYALLDKRDSLDASLEQVRAEINAQLTQ